MDETVVRVGYHVLERAWKVRTCMSVWLDFVAVRFGLIGL
ncbi:uncharacterized protein PpBr36_10007 [Pyricularia pennisetigena]|nr:uncharacterized protein PpBr36_10007 [Pyricularia pennisetigena]TLS22410.1 hypothetical protein PpBr36_10007 [Pyricularia pennisetigena]